jgi:hypothetical protein
LDIAERFRAVESFAPMLRFVEAVGASPASSQLFVSTSMFDLLVSDTPDFRTGDSTLCISYRPSDGMFQFRHRSYSGHDDEKSCTESEALETFRLFVRMKFGVLYEKPVA